MGWYLAWVVLHLGLLLIGSDGIFTDGYKTDDFWPFGDDDIGEYDIREFLVYTLFPFAILVVYSMVSAQNSRNNNKSEE